MIPVFDGHNDFLLRLLRAPERREEIWLRGDGTGHLDLPRMKRGGFAGGLFAIFVPSPPDPADALPLVPPYDHPLPAPLGQEAALVAALAMAGHLAWMERAVPRAFRLCRTVADLRNCLEAGIIAAVMHLEGAEAIDRDLVALEPLFAMGLRSIGPVWSRETAFGHGVPFRFPSGPDTGPGLTEAGRRLVRECNRLGIMIDLSHLNAAGVDDVAALSDAPLVATHSNAHAVTPSARNLTDRQLALIRDSGGLVGLNFATVFLRRDGRMSPEMGWAPVLRHLDHLIGALGEDHVGIGSDFDGTTVPKGIGDVTGLGALQAALRSNGYDTPLLEKLCHRNWVAVLEKTWKG